MQCFIILSFLFSEERANIFSLTTKLLRGSLNVNMCVLGYVLVTNRPEELKRNMFELFPQGEVVVNCRSKLGGGKKPLKIRR